MLLQFFVFRIFFIFFNFRSSLARLSLETEGRLVVVGKTSVFQSELVEFTTNSPGGLCTARNDRPLRAWLYPLAGSASITPRVRSTHRRVRTGGFPPPPERRSAISSGDAKLDHLTELPDSLCAKSTGCTSLFLFCFLSESPHEPIGREEPNSPPACALYYQWWWRTSAARFVLSSRA